MSEPSVLDVTYDDALAASRDGISLLRSDGLASPKLRAQSVTALRMLQRAGRTTHESDRRGELELHAGYWSAVRRVQAGQWDDSRIDGFDIERATPTTLPDEELERRAQSHIGLNSLYVLRRHLKVSGTRFAARNCRLDRTTSDLRVDDLELPSTQTIDCTFVGTAGRTVLSRALLRRTSVEIKGDTELEFQDTRVEAGHLAFESSTPVQVINSAFLGAEGALAKLTLVAPAVEFIECKLNGLELVDCMLARVTYTDSPHDEVVVRRGSLGMIEVRNGSAS